MTIKEKALKYVMNRTRRFREQANQPTVRLSDDAQAINVLVGELGCYANTVRKICSILLGENIPTPPSSGFHKNTIVVSPSGELTLVENSRAFDAVYAQDLAVQEWFDEHYTPEHDVHFAWLQDIEMAVS